MNDLEQFSSLILANQFGLIEKKEIIQRADQTIQDTDNPSYWLIELSTEGKSEEFEIVDTDEVIKSVLRIAYQKWKEKEISDYEFRLSLTNIGGIRGHHDGDWYPTLAWAEDDLALIEDGILDSDSHIPLICEELEKIMR